MSIYDWSTNPANNTSKPGIDWSEGMLPSAVNNSARQMMADVATFLTGPVFTGGYTVTGNSTITGTLSATGAITQGGNQVWHAGNFSPSNYASLSGATFTGPVGIGNAPAYRLDVGGIDGANIALRSTGTTDAALRLFVNGAERGKFSVTAGGQFYLEASGTERIRGTGVGVIVTGTLNATGAITQNGNQVWHAANLNAASLNAIYGYTPYSSANPSGYISSITSGMITTALGYTPYSAANPAGYLSSITSGNVTTALGFTPANAAGQTFSGAIGRDANFSLDLLGGNPRITFDSGDYLTYDRTANKLTLFIASAAVASVDASGNLKVAGSITAATTP